MIIHFLTKYVIPTFQLKKPRTCPRNRTKNSPTSPTLTGFGSGYSARIKTPTDTENWPKHDRETVKLPSPLAAALNKDYQDRNLFCYVQKPKPELSFAASRGSFFHPPLHNPLTSSRPFTAQHREPAKKVGLFPYP